MPTHLQAKKLRQRSATRRQTERQSAESKSSAQNGWFAARPSGTEDIYKIYTESFKSREHLLQIQQEAREIVSNAFKTAGV